MDNSHYGQLHIFHTIVQTGSISAAARKLEIAVPSASQALKLLEVKLGTPLFTRSTRHIQLTEAGQDLFERTFKAMATLNLALDEVKQHQSLPQGTVRITLSRFAYQLLFHPILADFHRTFPHIQLDLSINDGLSNLVTDQFDLGIRFGNRLDEGMVARKLLNGFKEGLYVSADYAKKFGVPKTIEQLKQHRLIGYRFISSNRVAPLVVNLNGQETTLDLPTPIMCNDPDIIIDATRQGLGIGRIAEYHLQKLSDKTDFIPILPKLWRNYPPVYLYYHQQKQKSKRVQAVIEFLVGKYGNR